MEHLEYANFILDPSEDLTPRLSKYKTDKHGNLWRFTHRKVWEVAIPVEQITEEDWISDISHDAEDSKDFGDFVRAYLKALEIRGIKRFTIRIFGFKYGFLYADE